MLFMSVAAWLAIGVLSWTVLSAALALALGRVVQLAEEHRPH